MTDEAAMSSDGGILIKKNMKKLNFPNCITVARMIGALCLLPVQPLSRVFYGLYTLTGFTDVLDGWLARKMKSESDFGAKLDSIADLLFYGVMLVKLLPILWTMLPLTLWCAVGAAAVVRLCAYGVTAWKYRRFVSLHTSQNKLTGGAVFLIPYVLRTPSAVLYCWAACSAAALASGDELVIHIRNKITSGIERPYGGNSGHGNQNQKMAAVRREGLG